MSGDARLIFITGGARSGKSSAAVEAAQASGRSVVFVATAEAGDDEMVERIALHQRERPHTWTTVEAPRGLALAVRSCDAEAAVVIDCLSLWMTNELLADGTLDSEKVDALGEDLLAACAGRRGPTVIVSNEVGSGIVPDNALARQFRDLLGRANQRIATSADDAYLAVAGRLLHLGEPSGALRV